MTKREQFLTCVYVASLAQDNRNGTRMAHDISQFAEKIPEESIPECPVNAAKVLIAYCTGTTARPFKWMF